jgi:hypothetical protein
MKQHNAHNLTSRHLACHHVPLSATRVFIRHNRKQLAKLLFAQTDRFLLIVNNRFQQRPLLLRLIASSLKTKQLQNTQTKENKARHCLSLFRCHLQSRLHFELCHDCDSVARRSSKHIDSQNIVRHRIVAVLLAHHVEERTRRNRKLRCNIAFR